MALTITKTTNGHFEFEPTSGEVSGDLKPRAKYKGNIITFKDSDGDIIEVVNFADLTVNDGTDDFTFASANLAFEKLKELGFGD